MVATPLVARTAVRSAPSGTRAYTAVVSGVLRPLNSPCTECTLIMMTGCCLNLLLGGRDAACLLCCGVG
jgi:hypothetical protein